MVTHGGERLELPADVTSAGVARNAVARLAARTGVDEVAVALCVSEAVTNAVVHAYREADHGRIEVCAWPGDGGLWVVVRDQGSGLAARGDSPGLGLGLPLMTAMADRFELVPTDPGTQVSLWFAANGGDQAGASAMG